MNTRNRWLTVMTLGLFILALPATLLAADPADEDEKDRDTKVIIVHDDGEEVVIEMEDIHEVMAEAMEGLDEAMAVMEDMQLQVRLGQDNKVDLSFDDTTLELDLDQIMAQVATAVQVGFDEFNTEEWTHKHDHWSEASDDDLREELKDLQREMKELRRELRKLKDADND